MTYYCSILNRIFTEMRYHPVLENFPEYESLRRAKIPFNQSEKYELPGLMIAGRNHPLLTRQPVYWQRHTLTTSKKNKANELLSKTLFSSLPIENDIDPVPITILSGCSLWFLSTSLYRSDLQFPGRALYCQYSRGKRYSQAALSLVQLLNHCALIDRELQSDEILSHWFFASFLTP